MARTQKPSDEIIQSFKSFRQRQEAVLDVVKLEIAQVNDDLEAASDSLTKTIAAAFPTLDDLPLELFSQAAAAAGEGRDFLYTRKYLEAADRKVQEKMKRFEAAHGSADTLAQNLSKAEGAVLAAQQAIADAVGVADHVEALRKFEFRLNPLRDFSHVHEIIITNSNQTDYQNRSRIVRAMSDRIDDGCNAVALYVKRGGSDIDADYKLRKALTDARKSLEARQSPLNNYNQLCGQLLGAEGMHGKLCANLADVLMHEAAAEVLARGLRPEQAEPLLLETLKLQNLRLVRDNLDTLETETRKLLGLPTREAPRPRKAATQPKAWTPESVAALGAQLDQRTDQVLGYVVTSRRTRETLRDFASTSRTYDDGNLLSFSVMQQNFLLLMVATTSNSATADCPLPAGLSLAPSIGHDFSLATTFSSHDLVPIPSLDGHGTALPGPDGSSSGSGSHGTNGYGSHGHGDGGGYSASPSPSPAPDGGGGGGGGDGGGGGGGACISCSIEDDPMMRRHLRFTPT